MRRRSVINTKTIRYDFFPQHAFAILTRFPNILCPFPSGFSSLQFVCCKISAFCAYFVLQARARDMSTDFAGVTPAGHIAALNRFYSVHNPDKMAQVSCSA